jgi:predicted dehydrogenase
MTKLRPMKLPRLFAPTESESSEMPAPLPPAQRVGFALVGLGRLSLEELLPAFGESRMCRPVALVSGDPAKAARVAARYGIESKAIYDYQTFDHLRDNEEVEVVYVVLPNSLHAEYTVRAAEAGKHVLCEKPMATSVAECQQMIDACEKANRKLMIAYRMQYEPNNREVIRLARAGEIGALKGFVSTNGQNQGDPRQWRLKKALAGGGALPDVGIYCLNAARYISGEEPIEVQALQYSTPKDPRFREVEEEVSFNLRFPSGFIATCLTSYGVHTSRDYRVLGATGWAELDPAFAYRGLSLRVARARQGSSGEEVTESRLEPRNQFALEMDHLAACLRDDRTPRTPGEEGLQDMRIIAAIYEAARSGTIVKLPEIRGRDVFRGSQKD